MYIKRKTIKYKQVTSNKQLHLYKKELREKATIPETLFKEKLEKEGFNFQFQYVFICYILDFFFPDKMLAIELDGKIHDHKKEYDEERDIFCKAYGIKVIRLKNYEIAEFNTEVIKNMPSLPREVVDKKLQEAKDFKKRLDKKDLEIAKNYKELGSYFKNQNVEYKLPKDVTEKLTKLVKKLNKLKSYLKNISKTKNFVDNELEKFSANNNHSPEYVKFRKDNDFDSLKLINEKKRTQSKISELERRIRSLQAAN